MFDLAHALVKFDAHLPLEERGHGAPGAVLRFDNAFLGQHELDVGLHEALVLPQPLVHREAFGEHEVQRAVGEVPGDGGLLDAEPGEESA